MLGIFEKSGKAKVAADLLSTNFFFFGYGMIPLFKSLPPPSFAWLFDMGCIML